MLNLHYIEPGEQKLFNQAIMAAIAFTEAEDIYRLREILQGQRVTWEDHYMVIRALVDVHRLLVQWNDDKIYCDTVYGLANTPDNVSAIEDLIRRFIEEHKRQLDDTMKGVNHLGQV